MCVQEKWGKLFEMSTKYTYLHILDFYFNQFDFRLHCFGADFVRFFTGQFVPVCEKLIFSAVWRELYNRTQASKRGPRHGRCLPTLCICYLNENRFSLPIFIESIQPFKKLLSLSAMNVLKNSLIKFIGKLLVGIVVDLVECILLGDGRTNQQVRCTACDKVTRILERPRRILANVIPLLLM